MEERELSKQLLKLEEAKRESFTKFRQVSCMLFFAGISQLLVPRNLIELSFCTWVKRFLQLSQS